MLQNALKTLYGSTLVRAAVAFALVTLLASWLAGGCKPTYVAGEHIEFKGTDLEGKPVSLAGQPFYGKVLLVDIWGLWCPACLQSVPGLVALQRSYQPRGFEVVGLEFAEGFEGPREEYLKMLQAWAKEHGINYTVVQAGETKDVEKMLPQLKEFQGFPTTILIGRDGRVRQVDTGTYFGAADEYARKIEILLQERVPQQ